MNEVKTLLNCDTKEFFKAFNSMRNDFDKFFKKTKLNEIIYKTADVSDDLSKEEREKAALKVYNERFRRVFEACFGDNLDLTYDVLKKVALGNEKYIESMGNIEIINFVFSVFTSPKLLPFFTVYFPTE